MPINNYAPCWTVLLGLKFLGCSINATGVIDSRPIYLDKTITHAPELLWASQLFI